MAKKKRKPLAHRTPLKRTRMNKISDKERKKLAGIRDARKAYRDEFPRCMLCGASPVCVHEITSGWAGRAKGIVEPAVWLSVCWNCNAFELTCNTKWPKARQLAAKRILDPSRFSLKAFNDCYTLGSLSIEDIDSFDSDVRRFLGYDQDLQKMPA